PSVWPPAARALNPVRVDTDPENMLSADEPVRVFHNAMKAEFSLYDMVVVGVVNEANPDGVFNVDSLGRIYELAQYARTLRWPDPGDPDKRAGVIEVDMLAPSTVDNIEQAGLGAVRFDWLMPAPPTTQAEALSIRERARRIPLFDGTLVSEDGRAVALYLPLTSKDLSYRVRQTLLEKVADWPREDRVYITGLPVAEDTFGVEMFYQMAISAPLAMLVVFLAMWWFFRSLLLILSPMILAMATVVATMALLVVTGNTIHIMSSMIPVFIMPIAVLDAVHILSEFFDRYPESRDRRRTIVAVMEHLFTPMLFTTLTTMAGFASLALTPIPPVQVFGVFVAIGVMLAWLWTMTFIPAFITFIPERRLAGFGRRGATEGGEGPLDRILASTGRATRRHARAVLAVTAILVAVAWYGVARIEVNDNPVKWFTSSHPIRVADRVLNEHFGGTYMAYLALEPVAAAEELADYVDGFLERLEARRQTVEESGIGAARDVFGEVRARAHAEAQRAVSKNDLLAALVVFAEERAAAAPDESYAAWDDALVFLDSERQRDQIFKQPEAVRYIDALQRMLETTGVVGKSNSLADIVKTVHRELLLGEAAAFRVPDTANAVAQTLLTYESSHRPQDLWHFVTPDYRKASIWLQLKSGDNKDMTRVAEAVGDFFSANPPPFGLEPRWFGLTYLNVAWQEKMVSGMLQALLGSFLVVLLLMTFLFRSALWGLLCMLPLTVSIALIYGLIGLIGKNYDMPIAVLSALSLGLAVDYAIHFLARTRDAYGRTGSWREALGAVFAEPARAITRNAIVLGVGFLPLLAAPLTPYKTVGAFIAAILLTAGLASLLILPAAVTLLEKWLFPHTRAVALTCNLGTSVLASGTLVAVVAISLYSFLGLDGITLAAYGVAATAVLAAG
ncbi:MAG TPA: MMPL family transporter, partial [Thermoleophilia bacterium]|nr:MMPL family transporter [Thermoleophilia bacterium]